MADPKTPRPAAARSPRAKSVWSDLVRSITTPLGFYVLALLIVESTLSLVLAASKLTEDHVWEGFKLMIYVFIGVLLAVTVFAKWWPKNLLYGKEEHANPALDPSALHDAVEEIIAKNVKDEALKQKP